MWDNDTERGGTLDVFQPTTAAMVTRHHPHRAIVRPCGSLHQCLPVTERCKNTYRIKIFFWSMMFCVAGLENVYFYLDHGKQGASKQLSELSSDVQHVHLTTSHHHSNQGVIVSACTLKKTMTHAVFIPFAKAEITICSFIKCFKMSFFMTIF